MPKASAAALAVLQTCVDRGWVEHLQSGSIHIWKITPEGRAALDGAVDVLDAEG